VVPFPAGSIGTNCLVEFTGAVCNHDRALARGWELIQGGCRMALIHQFLASLRRDEEGQGLAEYALILALIAIIAIVALIFLGGQVSTILSKVGASV
jgi:pilus assembly protein Flp/PilA